MRYKLPVRSARACRPVGSFGDCTHSMTEKAYVAYLRRNTPAESAGRQDAAGQDGGKDGVKRVAKKSALRRRGRDLRRAVLWENPPRTNDYRKLISKTQYPFQGESRTLSLVWKSVFVSLRHSNITERNACIRKRTEKAFLSVFSVLQGNKLREFAGNSRRFFLVFVRITWELVP